MINMRLTLAVSPGNKGFAEVKAKSNLKSSRPPVTTASVRTTVREIIGSTETFFNLISIGGPAGLISPRIHRALKH